MRLSIGNRVKAILGPFGTIKALRAIHFGYGRKCPICGAWVRRFLDQGYRYRVLYEQKVVGGVPRAADECPVCRANDRTRLVYLYLSLRTPFFEGSARTLHIAPERAIMLKALALPDDMYICGDIEPERYLPLRPIAEMNVCALPFDDDTFDLVICNHVLEHVQDDRRAMRELARILKPTGCGVLQVPIALRLDQTSESHNIVEPVARAKYFGQDDHVRLYAEKDYVARLVHSNFRVSRFDPYVDEPEMAYELDINPFELLYICTPDKDSGCPGS